MRGGYYWAVRDKRPAPIALSIQREEESSMDTAWLIVDKIVLKTIRYSTKFYRLPMADVAGVRCWRVEGVFEQKIKDA